MKKPFKNQTTNSFWALSVKHILYYTMCGAYTDLFFTVKGFSNLKFGSAWVTHDILSCSVIDHKAEWGGSQGVIPFWKQSPEERGTLIATPRLYAWHLVATPGIAVLDCRGWFLKVWGSWSKNAFPPASPLSPGPTTYLLLYTAFSKYDPKESFSFRAGGFSHNLRLIIF